MTWPIHMEVSVKARSRKINKIEYNTVGKKYFFEQKQQQAARCLTSQRAREKKQQQTNKYKVHSELRCSVFTTKPKTYCNLISHWQSI